MHFHVPVSALYAAGRQNTHFNLEVINEICYVDKEHVQVQIEQRLISVLSVDRI